MHGWFGERGRKEESENKNASRKEEKLVRTPNPSFQKRFTLLSRTTGGEEGQGARKSKGGKMRKLKLCGLSKKKGDGGKREKDPP